MDRSRRQHLELGISHQYVDGMGLIEEQRWRYASTVGACRAKVGGGCCGGHLLPRQPYQIGRVTWYETECSGCHQVMASPNGRVLPSSSALSEQPAGEMSRRREQWVRLAKLENGEAA